MTAMSPLPCLLIKNDSQWRHFKDFPSWQSSPPLSVNSKHLGCKNTLFVSRYSCSEYKLCSSMIIWSHSQSQLTTDTSKICQELNNVCLFPCDLSVPANDNCGFIKILHLFSFLHHVITICFRSLC